MSTAHRANPTRGVYQATWGRVFARVYDTAFTLAERRGLREIRREVAGRAAGRVIELGAGTGLNLPHYRDSVSSLVLTEPDPHMASKLRRRVASSSLDATVVETPAERLPFDDASIDTVVSTLVLCTVDSPHRALSEVARVLCPGGAFLFVEHVRSPSPRAAWFQDRFNLPWSWYACGCQCNRDTVAAIGEASLELGGIRRDRLRWISPLVRPLVVGAATPTRRDRSVVLQQPGAQAAISAARTAANRSADPGAVVRNRTGSSNSNSSTRGEPSGPHTVSTRA
jgi:SAM-dependent methyltransferase